MIARLTRGGGGGLFHHLLSHHRRNLRANAPLFFVITILIIRCNFRELRLLSRDISLPPGCLFLRLTGNLKFTSWVIYSEMRSTKEAVTVINPILRNFSCQKYIRHSEICYALPNACHYTSFRDLGQQYKFYLFAHTHAHIKRLFYLFKKNFIILLYLLFYFFIILFI